MGIGYVSCVKRKQQILIIYRLIFTFIDINIRQIVRRNHLSFRFDFKKEKSEKLIYRYFCFCRDTYPITRAIESPYRDKTCKHI